MTARYRGDEFVILFPDQGPRLETLRARIERHLKTVVLAGTEIPLSISLGLARFPADGKGIDDLLAVADARMYAAKEAGRGQKRDARTRPKGKEPTSRGVRETPNKLPVSPSPQQGVRRSAGCGVPGFFVCRGGDKIKGQFVL